VSSAPATATGPETAQVDELKTWTMRKVAARVIPVLLVLYVIAYLDLVNVTVAQDKLQSDLGFLGAVYGFGAWQWLFLIEAIPAVLAFFVLSYLDDGPEHADWLEDDEKRWLARRLEGEELARLHTLERGPRDEARFKREGAPARARHTQPVG
jgi:hypothetical protein